MEALKILKKLALYLVFFAAATLFFYYSIQLGLSRYGNVTDVNDGEYILKTIYLPVLYLVLGLAVCLLTQVAILKDSSPNSKKLYGIALMVFFGILLGSGILMLAYGLVRIPNNTHTTDPIYWALPLIPVFGVSLSEILAGLYLYLINRKIEKSEEVSENPQ